MRYVYKILVGEPQRNRLSASLGVDGAITLKRILKKLGVGLWNELMWLGIRTSCWSLL